MRFYKSLLILKHFSPTFWISESLSYLRIYKDFLKGTGNWYFLKNQLLDPHTHADQLETMLSTLSYLPFFNLPSSTLKETNLPSISCYCGTLFWNIKISRVPNKGAIWKTDVDVEKTKDSNDRRENHFADSVVMNSLFQQNWRRIQGKYQLIDDKKQLLIIGHCDFWHVMQKLQELIKNDIIYLLLCKQFFTALHLHKPKLATEFMVDLCLILAVRNICPWIYKNSSSFSSEMCFKSVLILY